MSDPLDPRLWLEVPLVRNLYLGHSAEQTTLVDLDIWEKAINYKWYICVSGSGKAYVRRTDGFYLHQFVMLRKGIFPPSRRHKYIDHMSGDTMDNRECNLRWATASENGRNHNGCYARQHMINFGGRT